MLSARSTLVFSAIAASLMSAVAGAAPLVTESVDEGRLVTLAGNTRPEVSATTDRGAVDPGLRLDHMRLQLKRSPAQEAEVEHFVDTLHDPSSPNYHRWLTAEEYGSRFGADPADLRAVTGWLTAKGFTIEGVAAGRMTIDFSGTAGTVATAFHTEIHDLSVAGVAHIANVRDPQIPAALAPVIAGVTSLHDFRPHSKHRPAHRDYTGNYCGGPCYAMAPGDLQKIYGMTAVYASGITGAGQTVAVVEDTNLFSNNDFTNFRKVFGLSASYPTGKLVVTHPAPSTGTNNCPNPGVNSDGDDVEATLDVEWASAAAPGATIELASCDSTNTTDGVTTALQNLVDAKTTPQIISVSYGNCEADNGASGNSFFNTLFQQAVTEGISIFVATGDDGPTDCTYNASFVTDGIGVNGWAATQYNVAVGGTDFYDTYSNTNAKFWNATSSATSSPPWSSAKSYIPEAAWNDSCGSTMLANYVNGSAITYGSTGFCNVSAGSDYLGTDGGEGGPSACFSGTPATTDVVGGTCKGYPKPSWQKGIFGNPVDGVRDLPDIAMFAADGVWDHYFLLCFTDAGNGGGPCTGNPGSWPPGGGGTSYATPIAAGIQALVNQKMKVRQGNPNNAYYKLAAAEYGTSGNTGCNSNWGAAFPTSCVFHDVTLGDSAQPCKPPHNCYRPSGTYGVLSTSNTAYAPAFAAHPGWDFVAGIGTINAAALVSKWSTVAP